MNIILHSSFTRMKLNKISILIVFKKKNITKEGEIENFFNKLFSPTNYHLLSFQIFFSTPARFVSSRSQSEHDLIFFWLNLPPRVRQNIEATNDTLSRDYKPSESSFLALGRNLRPTSSALGRPYMCSVFAGPRFPPEKESLLPSYCYLFSPLPSFPSSMHTRNDRGLRRREGARPVNTFKTGIRLLVFVEGEDFSADLSTEICAVTEESSKPERNGSKTMKTLAKKSSVLGMTIHF